MDLPSNDWNLVAKAFFSAHAPGALESVLPCLVPKSFYAGAITVAARQSLCCPPYCML